MTISITKRLNVFFTALLALFLSIQVGNADTSPVLISGTEARHLIQDKGAILVDVRTMDEFKQKHIVGALHFPVESFQADSYHFGEFNRPIVVYCRSGRRSEIAKQILLKAGFKDVYNMGPLENWDK